ncbi:MAG TPA: hypothetical protein VHL34_24635 [Rhizomicrobium sp.]|jgi:hypothetical protein|nr:hypothetical protein [Rhizomicrobium sp.]
MTDTLRAERGCRCDCVNCVTGNHDGCYYRPGECALKAEAPPLTCIHGVLLTRPCVGCDTPSEEKD